MAGLAIVKFGGSGIRLTTNGGNIIATDQIGTDPSGASGLGNMGDAVTIVGAPGNTIGGTISQLSNQLSNSGGSGISISGAGATGNVVEGNFIGTNAALAGLGNSGDGVDILAASAATRSAGRSRGRAIRSMTTIALASKSSMVRRAPWSRATLSRSTLLAASGSTTRRKHHRGDDVPGPQRHHRQLLLPASRSLAGSTGNLVQGNYIGVDASGTHP